MCFVWTSIVSSRLALSNGSCQHLAQLTLEAAPFSLGRTSHGEPMYLLGNSHEQAIMFSPACAPGRFIRH